MDRALLPPMLIFGDSGTTPQKAMINSSGEVRLGQRAMTRARKSPA